MVSARTVVFERPGLPLALRTADVPAPRPGELLVRVTLAGICGTDAHRLGGDLAAPPVPVCFGHEAVGVIQALGDGVDHDTAGTPLAVGDRVYWHPPITCGECRACVLDDYPVACEKLVWPAPADRPNAAGFQELATLSRRNIVFRIPDATPDEAVIAFGCAMPTALAGFRRLGPPRGSVLIQGCGPVGLASVVTATLGGAEQIIVIGAPSSRLDVALQLGATNVIPLDCTTIDLRYDTVMRLTDGHGIDTMIEATGHPSAFEEGFALLAPNGRYLILGLYSGNAVLPVDLVRVNNRNLRIIGSLGARDEDYRRTVEIATEYGEKLDFAALVTDRFPLDRTEEAIRFAATGVPVKAVVTP